MTNKLYSTTLITGTKTYNVINNLTQAVANEAPLSQYKAGKLAQELNEKYKADGTEKKAPGRKATVLNLAELQARKAEIDLALTVAREADNAKDVKTLRAEAKVTRRLIRKAKKQQAA